MDTTNLNINPTLGDKSEKTEKAKKNGLLIKMRVLFISRVLRLSMLSVIMVGTNSSGYCYNIQVMGLVLESNESDIKMFDMNGVPCALVQVAIPGNAEFEGNIINITTESRKYHVENFDDDKERTNRFDMDMNLYSIYMSEGSKFIRIKAQGYDPTLVIFKEYNIDKVKSNSVYSLLLSSITDHVNKDNRISMIVEKAKGHYYNKEYTKAIPLFREGAASGNKDAYYYLGMCYDNGYGVLNDYKKASEYYRLASEKGMSIATNSLAILYLYGRGMPEDQKEAVRFFKQSAQEGCDLGCYNVGVCYEYGMGVDQDFKQASEWYEKAMEMGNGDAKKKDYVKQFVVER